ncbi:MAG: GDP-mannose 4,6-dehydratase [Deltaproteobacteria bacterium]|nr:GDP-mannose 4,6-dehydratase [Deltaproteobacteria bacterium]
MLKNSNILISGGAGFIGSRFVKRIIEHNKITVFDNLHRDALTKTDLFNHPNLTFVQGDVRDLNGVKEVMKNKTHVLHLAAIAGVDTVMNNPLLTMEVIMKGTFNMLEAAVDQKGIERFVDISTSEVFGSYAFRVNEQDITSLGAVGQARWTYAVSKLATEHLAHVMYYQKKLPTVSIRPFNIFGPGQVGEGAIHHFIVQALHDKDVTVHNEGDQIRAWCYIEDFMNGLELCLEHENAPGKTFNIGNPRTAITVYNLAALILKLTNSKGKLLHVDWPHTDVELRIPDITNAKNTLGYKPLVDLEEGLLKTIEWYKNN